MDLLVIQGYKIYATFKLQLLYTHANKLVTSDPSSIS